MTALVAGDHETGLRDAQCECGQGLLPAIELDKPPQLFSCHLQPFPPAGRSRRI